MSIRALLGSSRQTSLLSVPGPLIARHVRRMCGQPHSAVSHQDTDARGPQGTPEMLNEGGQSLRLRKILTFNEQFVAEKRFEAFRSREPPSSAAKRCVVVSCMDSRLTHLLPHALDLGAGDAKIIKNAGGIVAHPFGSVMRSVIVALYELNAQEVFVVGHRDCGMSTINPARTVERMLAEGGVDPRTLETLEYAGIDVRAWLHGFSDVQAAVRNSVSVIARHPLLPTSALVHGLIIDPDTGALELVVDGAARPQMPRASGADASHRVGNEVLARRE